MAKPDHFVKTEPEKQGGKHSRLMHQANPAEFPSLPRLDLSQAGDVREPCKRQRRQFKLQKGSDLFQFQWPRALARGGDFMV
jgi:hypothetical protein